MQMVKIQIPEHPKLALATLEIARRGRIDGYPDNVYVVAEPALQILEQHGVAYIELGRGGFDYAEKTLRDALAAHAQRRPARRSRKTQKHT